jgi:hypothetical protein
MQDELAQYQYEIHDSVLQVDSQEWNKFICHTDLAMNQALIH